MQRDAKVSLRKKREETQKREEEMKADVSVEFYCYIDESGMMKFITGPKEDEEEETNQEELPLDAKEDEEDDTELLEQAKEASDAIQKALEEVGNGKEAVEEAANGATAKQPLTLTSLLDGMCTGKKMKGSAVFRKEEIRDLLDAEREGLRPLFIVSIK